MRARVCECVRACVRVCVVPRAESGMGQQLKEFHEFFKDHVLDEPKSYYQYDDTPGVLPHVWFDVKQVTMHAVGAMRARARMRTPGQCFTTGQCMLCLASIACTPCCCAQRTCCAHGCVP